MVQAARSGLLHGLYRKASTNQDTIKPTSAPKMYFLIFDLCIVLFCPSPRCAHRLPVSGYVSAALLQLPGLSADNLTSSLAYSKVEHAFYTPEMYEMHGF